MVSFIAALIFLFLALGGVVARKTYNYVPAKELRRRAQQHDPLAKQLYRAVAYGESLELLLGLFITILSAGSFVLLARIAPIWLSLVAVILLIWVAFSVVPSSRVTSFGVWLTSLVTPLISKLLSYLHPIFGHRAHKIATKRRAQSHTGLFERADVLELLEKQKEQEDSRLDASDLALVKHALKFTDETIGQVMTPLGAAKFVPASDTIGPILIDELHKASLSYVPVTESSDSSQVVGILQAHKLGLNSKGQVGDVMDRDVYYLHEDDSLSEALRAFETNGCPACIVVDSTNESVGLITIKAVLGQLLGDFTADFDRYSDRVAVSKRHSAEQSDTDELMSESVADEDPQMPEDEENLPETDQTVVE